MDDLTEEDLVIPPVKYEFLDHPADVQIHAWGETLKEAFEQCAIALYAYQTDIRRVEIRVIHHIEAEGYDLENLLFKFLTELLFLFSAEPYIVGKKVKITEFVRGDYKNSSRIKATVYGEEFDISKHSQEAEVKAITYSSMQIWEQPDVEQPEVYVIVDV